MGSRLIPYGRKIPATLTILLLPGSPFLSMSHPLLPLLLPLFPQLPLIPLLLSSPLPKPSLLATRNLLLPSPLVKRVLLNPSRLTLIHSRLVKCILLLRSRLVRRNLLRLSLWLSSINLPPPSIPPHPPLAIRSSPLIPTIMALLPIYILR